MDSKGEKGKVYKGTLEMHREDKERKKRLGEVCVRTQGREDHLTQNVWKRSELAPGNT